MSSAGAESDEVPGDFEPNWASPPGDTMRDILEHRGIGAPDLGSALGMSPTQVSWLLRGWTHITEDLADALAGYLGASPEFWLRRDAQYRQARRRLSSGQRAAPDAAGMIDQAAPFAPLFTKPLTVFTGPANRRRRQMLAQVARVPDNLQCGLLQLEARLELGVRGAILEPRYEVLLEKVMGEALGPDWRQSPPACAQLAGPLVQTLGEALELEKGSPLLLCVEYPELGLDVESHDFLAELLVRVASAGTMWLVVDASSSLLSAIVRSAGTDWNHLVSVVEPG